MSTPASKPGFYKYTFMWGLIIGLFCVMFYFGLYLSRQMTNNNATWVMFLFTGVAAVLSVLRYRKKALQGYISFSQAFSVAYIPYLYAGIFTTIYQALFLKFVVTEEYINRMTQDGTAKLANQGYTEKQINVSVKLIRYIFDHPIISLSMNIIAFVFLGALVSLIAAAIGRKEAVDIFFED